MKANWLVFTFLLSSAAVFQLAAQQTEADRRSVALLRAKAEQGDARSQFELGTVFHFGGLGVAKDAVEAVKWYRKAAEQNHVWAQYNLAVCYRTGEGVAKDYVEAVKWVRKAAEQNDVEAEYDLGVSYYNGEGVAKDYVQAYTWFLLAAGQGHEDAKNIMAVLEKKMTAEQIAKGQKAGAQFQAARGALRRER